MTQVNKTSAKSGEMNMNSLEKAHLEDMLPVIKLLLKISAKDFETDVLEHLEKLKESACKFTGQENESIKA